MGFQLPTSTGYFWISEPSTVSQQLKNHPGGDDCIPGILSKILPSLLGKFDWNWSSNWGRRRCERTDWICHVPTFARQFPTSKNCPGFIVAMRQYEPIAILNNACFTYVRQLDGSEIPAVEISRRKPQLKTSKNSTHGNFGCVFSKFPRSH